jgi:hypothetical protein
MYMTSTFSRSVTQKIDQNRPYCLKKDAFLASVTPCSYGGFFCLLDQGVRAGLLRV